MRPLSLAALLLAGAAPVVAQDAAPKLCTPQLPPNALKAFAKCVEDHIGDFAAGVTPEQPKELECVVPGTGPGSVRFVGANSEDYVIMDPEMVGCGDNRYVVENRRENHPSDYHFLHGLTVLHAASIAGPGDGSVSQVQDIWELAWKTGSRYLSENDLVLIAGDESRGQLHVQMVQFADSARELFLKQAVPLGDLKAAFDVAEKQRKKTGDKTGTIVVAKNTASDGFALALVPNPAIFARKCQNPAPPCPKR